MNSILTADADIDPGPETARAVKLGSRLAGKVAAVTGGAAGIGQAICLRLAAEGARVAVLDLDQARAQQTVRAAGGAGLATAVDVSDSGAVDAAITRIENELGPLDIFVNNAGASGAEHIMRVGARLDAQRAEAATGEIKTPLDALVRLRDDEWRRLLAIHLDGTFYGTRAAARSMVDRGTGGAIVNMASVCGLEGCAGHPHYSAAKAGIIGFTRSVAKELILQRIRVNAVAPGFIDTATGHGRVNENRRDMALRTPAGRLGTPAEVAATVAFLVSDDASYFVGATLSPNGGLVTAV
jgi:3-oxoacyl-[acyl-carrier protein] reductase